MSGDKLELRGRIAIHELEEVRQATLFDDNKDNGVRSPSSSIDKSDNKGKYSKRRRSNVAVIIVRIVFISLFLFYCLLLNHSFQTNPNRITNYF